MKTQAAQAAQMIRRHLKQIGVKASVTSKIYAGGSSVDVTMVDQDWVTAKAVEKYVRQFQYGHFDGMNDIYEYTNRRDDLPQVKYAFVRNEMSDAKKQEVYSKIRSEWAGADALPENYADACNKRLESAHEYVSALVWREFNREAA